MTTQSRAALIRICCAFILITFMMTCANIFGDKDFIFPEIGALCVGLWIVDKRVWRVVRWQIPVLFAVAATAGVGIVNFAPSCFALQIEIGFFAVATLLTIFNTNIMPAFPACMLPILIGTGSWLYPIVVGIGATILVAGQYAMERTGLRTPQEQTVPKTKLTTQDATKWLTLMALLVPMIFLGEHFGLRFVLAPPLIVTLVEFANTSSGFRDRPFFVLTSLVVAAIVGSASEGILHQTLNFPQFVTAPISSAIVLFAFHGIRMYFAPAVAISLIPTILPIETVSTFPLHVAIGAAYFIFMAKILFPAKTITPLSN